MKAFILLWALGTDFGQSRLSLGSQRFESKTACEKAGAAMAEFTTRLDSRFVGFSWKCVGAE